MKLSVEITDETRKRIKVEADKNERSSTREAAIMLNEALDARDKKAGRKA